MTRERLIELIRMQVRNDGLLTGAGILADAIMKELDAETESRLMDEEATAERNSV